MLLGTIIKILAAFSNVTEITVYTKYRPVHRKIHLFTQISAEQYCLCELNTLLHSSEYILSTQL